MLTLLAAVHRSGQIVTSRSISRNSWSLLSVLLSLILLAACTTLPKGDPDVDTYQKQLGFASWYGPNFDGKQTASGERFAMGAFTAAHRTLPFGTVLLVTNLANQRQVQVRVNDRGPYIHGRILDLSFAAAEQLEMLNSGTSRISLVVIRSDEVARSTPESDWYAVVAKLIPPGTSLRQGDQEGVLGSNAFKYSREVLRRSTSLGDIWQRRPRRLVTFVEPQQI